MTAVGIIGISATWDSGSYTTRDIIGFITLFGIIADILSIPFFITASINEKKAARLAISNQSIYLPQNKSLAFNTQPTPSLTLTIRF